MTTIEPADAIQTVRSWVDDVHDDEDLIELEAGTLRALLAALPEKRDGRGPGVPGAMHLAAFGQTIADAFGHCPYHVGSSATSKVWRDVDVRLILDDDKFDALFPGFAKANHIDAFWSLMCAALSELGKARTGLPIDFQIQSMTKANTDYPTGIRNPLFLIRADEDQVPTMLAAAEQPEPCDGDCDCDCQPGQPCLCPERDCYCGPCPVCDRDEEIGCPR